MIYFLIVTHGDFGAYLLEAAEGIAGQAASGTRALSLSNRWGIQEIRDKLQKAVQEMASPDGLILLTDMLGGTPANTALSLVQNQDKIRVLTGLNLYMLISGLTHRKDLSLEDLAQKMLEDGKKSILDAKSLFLRKVG